MKLIPLDPLKLKTTINGVTISTIRLPFQHSGMWYETCAFFLDGSDVVDRYESAEAAESGHDKYVAMLRDWAQGKSNGVVGDYALLTATYTNEAMK